MGQSAHGHGPSRGRSPRSDSATALDGARAGAAEPLAPPVASRVKPGEQSVGVPKSSDGETIPGARTTTTAGSDGSSRATGPGPPGLVRTPRREMSEGGDPPTPPSGEPTIDLSDPAATTGRGGSPAATGPPAPAGFSSARKPWGH